ncbi:MAG: RNA polymerase sporulation sigma factor SigK [Clostridia bacterium]|nr:RNA polymerase sporulation sigma factor SigK [Clostridia bacterium]
MFLFSLIACLSDLAFTFLAHIASDCFPKPLSPEDQRLYIERMQNGDRDAKQLLIAHNLRLVAHIAKKYQRSGLDLDDIVSIGSIGLIKAVNSFRPEAGKLASYASRCIENEILMALRFGKKQKNNVSLNEPIGSDRDGNEIMLGDILGSPPDAVHDLAEINIESSKAMGLISRILTRRERAVILLRYGLEDRVQRPQHEVARALGISRSYVSRIEKKALEKLRDALGGFDAL